ncbi:uncharacterized protein CCOS01_13650 [Colletotrichum costaricense]|uniref:Uncharacterized protein n=1 Tax=Colletotrichum costaricense TaxID=1209916 RepID=A0AAJ0DV75_9PEZI|nr:uncharacterized protein CCOS01_13650 [Colletotrichum costaricense]KAK1514370.1 hypothetical protein CCOS01_13650 [Colletotrichum costaricense]
MLRTSLNKVTSETPNPRRSLNSRASSEGQRPTALRKAGRDEGSGHHPTGADSPQWSHPDHGRRRHSKLTQPDSCADPRQSIPSISPQKSSTTNVYLHDPEETKQTK